ncbi:TetR/AcrR family transcriptional regulator [Streptomyces mexicanus]|jgi:AcrR family transcriptional regulator|uniref:TetR/AcrR family transcriptional regulator n=1 Tax=Streptomyces mexicanus TaxID=178566 RepID=UPI00369817D8
MTNQVRTRAASGNPPPRRARRLDAVRNHDALVAAAREEFEANGAEAPLKAVARRAGVGIATLYRNFPTRTSLLAAVYAEDVADTVESLCLGASAAGPPADSPVHEAWEACATWLRRFARAVATDAAMRETFSAGAPALAQCRQALADAFGSLLARTGTALPPRRGLAVEEFLRTVVSVAVSPFLTCSQRELALTVLLDGLRYRADPACPEADGNVPETQGTKRA